MDVLHGFLIMDLILLVDRARQPFFSFCPAGSSRIVVDTAVKLYGTHVQNALWSCDWSGAVSAYLGRIGSASWGLADASFKDDYIIRKGGMRGKWKTVRLCRKKLV